nr:MAG TPA: hypothetical protein [Caudoviricetes sp.]
MNVLDDSLNTISVPTLGSGKVILVHLWYHIFF